MTGPGEWGLGVLGYRRRRDTLSKHIAPLMIAFFLSTARNMFEAGLGSATTRRTNRTTAGTGRDDGKRLKRPQDGGGMTASRIRESLYGRSVGHTGQSSDRSVDEGTAASGRTASDDRAGRSPRARPLMQRD